MGGVWQRTEVVVGGGVEGRVGGEVFLFVSVRVFRNEWCVWVASSAVRALLDYPPCDDLLASSRSLFSLLWRRG